MTPSEGGDPAVGSEGGDGEPPRPPGGIGYHRGGRATFTREGASRDRPERGARRTTRAAWIGIALIVAAAVVVGWLLVG